MREFDIPYVQFKGRFLPIVNIAIKGKFWQGLQVFVDSGASFSMIHSSIADAIGIEIEEGKLVYVTVGDGGEIPVYVHHMPVRLKDIEFEADVGFSEKLGIGFNILGRKDLFERFMFCFSDSKRITKVIEVQ